jgi:prepilin-type N-terminal cleavage/methylation domain-containing protein
MKSQRAFTLIEAAVVLLIISVLAAITVGAARAAGRNAGTGASALKLVTTLQGQRSLALTEQRDRVVLVAGATNPTACSWANDTACAHVWVLAPNAGWALSDFGSGPATNAAIIDSFALGTGVKLDTATQLAGPAPFSGVTSFEAATTGSCGGVTCVAVRFGANGQVSPVFAGTVSTKTGWSLVLASDLQGVTRAAVRYEVIVGVPTGVVKYLAL